MSRRRAALAVIPKLMPAPGDRIGAVCGPGEFASDNAGIVICLMDNGSDAIVLMDSGLIEHCSSLNRGPGIGWHMVRPAA